MKKVFYATLALGALILASCQKENQVNLPKVESPVFTAHIDNDSPVAQPETKTSLTEVEGKFKSYWNKGDEIRVLNGTNKEGCDAIYTTNIESNSPVADFTTTTEGYTGSQFVAIYPGSYNAHAWWNIEYPGVVNKLWLTPNQTATAGTYDPNAHVAVAYSKNASLEFKNAVSLLKFTVVGDNISEVRVYANTETNVLAGNFGFGVTGTDSGKIYTDTDGYVNYRYIRATGEFTNGSTYYIACLPTTFTTGLTLEVFNGDVKGKTKSSSLAYTLARNKILDLGTISYEASTADTRTLYLKPGSNWLKQDNNGVSPWFAVYLFDGDDEAWKKMTAIEGTGYYKVDVPTSYRKVIFCRMNGNDTNSTSWSNVWNQTSDLSNTDLKNNCYTVADDAWSKGDGKWSIF